MSISVRSSVKSEKDALLDELKQIMEKLGGSMTLSGDYPAWEYQKDSCLRDLMVEVFKEQYGHEPIVTVIHAGLECGLFADKIPGLDCVSYGPELHDVHSVRERLGIASVGRVYDLTVKVLELLD
jgi:dipeptidase D